MKFLYFTIILITLLSISMQSFLKVEDDNRINRKKMKNLKINKLKRKTYTLVENNIQTYKEKPKIKKLLDDLLTAVKNDRELLDNVFEIKDFEFFEFSLGISEDEMHADGKGVVIMSFRNKNNVVKKVVYKSYSLLTYFTFAGLFSQIEKNCKKFDKDFCDFVTGKKSVFEAINSHLTQSFLPVYKVIPMEINVGKDEYMLSSYGYIEFIEQDSHIAAGFFSHIYNYLTYKFGSNNYSSYWNNDKLTFSYTAGLISAATEVFKMPDFHNENFILNGKVPILIDVENVFDFNREKLFSAKVFLGGIKRKYPHTIDPTRFRTGITDFLCALKYEKTNLLKFFNDSYLQNYMMFRVVPVYTSTWASDGDKIHLDKIKKDPIGYVENINLFFENSSNNQNTDQKVALLLHIDDNTIKDIEKDIIPILFGKLNEKNYFTVRNERIDYSKNLISQNVKEMVEKNKFKYFTTHYENLRNSIENITPITKIKEYITKNWVKEGLVNELYNLL